MRGRAEKMSQLINFLFFMQRIISTVDESENRAFYYPCVQFIFLRTCYVLGTILSGVDLTTNKACKFLALSYFVFYKRLAHAIGYEKKKKQVNERFPDIKENYISNQ